MPSLNTGYDKRPVIKAAIQADNALQGWGDIYKSLLQNIQSIKKDRKLVVLEYYQGVLEAEVKSNLVDLLPGDKYNAHDYLLPEESIGQLIYPDTTDDAVFGFITRLELSQFFDRKKLLQLYAQLEAATGTIIVYGIGASLLASAADLLVYFDMPRWELQLRFRRNQISTLGSSDKYFKASLQYKQAFFVDWRVLDKHKKTLMHRWNWVVDTTIENKPNMVAGKDLNNALAKAVTQPFRLVPFFDPGPWGGQWMKEKFGLSKDEPNFAWCFDCVPEENSLLLQFGEIIFETPSINLVFQQAVKLLGEAVQARFGDEFPIRFDFLDTIGGGNLSLQVHPYKEYARAHFGMDYTQDESYYMLDAAPGAHVYLGLKDDTVKEDMIAALKEANKNGTAFNAEQYVAKWEVKKHDHVLIPAGTVHCSGKDSMVLEISATPYIFTFKLYDWGRMGLDGKPRPINIEHGEKNINWSLRPERTKKELINVFVPVADGDGWREEKTGLHDREFIETRRHLFTKKVTHQTNGIVNVLNLVEGDEVLVESPTNDFEPYIIHYAETFVIPANVAAYTITPHGTSIGKECATLKAFVRTNP